MHILYFTQSHSPHDQRFVHAMCAHNHEVTILRLKQQSNKIEIPKNAKEISWKGVKDKLRFIDIFNLVPELKRITDQVRPDVIHAGPIQDVAFLAALSKFHPIVSMSWGFDMMRDVDLGLGMYWKTKYVLKNSDLLAVDCQSVANRAVSLGFNEHHIINFPWGVDLDHFSKVNGMHTAKKIRKELGWEDKFVILCLRSWEPQYGVVLLVKAFIEASQKDQNLRLLLLGNGSCSGIINRYLSDANLNNKVYLGGVKSLGDLPSFYCTADLYVSPSHVDGSSVSLLEAMACEIPSLVSDIPTNREWITEGVEGWQFRDNDIADLIEKILNLSRLENLEEAGKAARRLVEERANWNKNIEKLFTGYEKIIGKQSLDQEL